MNKGNGVQYKKSVGRSVNVMKNRQNMVIIVLTHKRFYVCCWREARREGVIEPLGRRQRYKKCNSIVNVVFIYGCAFAITGHCVGERNFACVPLCACLR